MSKERQNVETLARWLRESSHVVAFTGAGFSTDSGIPDFRGPEGAASLVGLATRRRARVVLVNRGETPYDEAVTLRLWEGIGEVLPPAVELLKSA